MIEFLIPLVGTWLPFWNLYILPFFGLAIVAFAFRFIHYLFRR